MIDDQKAVYAALLQAQQNGAPVVIATIISTNGSMPRHAGSKMLIKPDGSIIGTIGGGAMEAQVIASALQTLKDNQTRIETYTLNNLEHGDPGICGGSAQVFIEPIISAPTLLVIGGGHCGVALCQLGKWMGYQVILSDDRPEFCNVDHLPGMDNYVVCPPALLPERVSIDANTYVAAVTRGLPIDIDLIPALLNTEAAYIGLIGSRRRWALTVEALETQKNITHETLARIHAPIGLELEAETPKEIALSIMAEIVMIRRGGTGKPMQWLDKVQITNQ